MTLRGALLAAALLAAARWAAADPALSVMPPSVDAGRVERTASAAATVRIANAGTGTLKLLALQLLDGGTGAAADWTVTAGAPCGATLPPSCALTGGLSTDLDLAFEPTSIGVRDAILLINYHDTADRSISIPLRGVGIGPTLEIVGAPALLDFGTLPAGVAGALTLAVTNHGTRDLADGALAIAPAGSPFSAGTGKLAVTTSAETPVTVTCTPSAGMSTASLQLSAPDVPGPPIQIALRCAGDPARVLVATPPAILLGEVRLAAPVTAHVAIASRAAPIDLTAAALDPAIPALTVSGIPATTPATLDLAVAPRTEGSLDGQLTVTPRTGAPLAIAVTGRAVTPSVSAPPAVSLGTFCVQQPTTPRIVTLTSTGSATVALSAPALHSAKSPFDLERVAPLDYPNVLAPGQRAFVAVTPQPSSVAGVASDDLVWTTDAGAAPSRTALTATFLADGGAIAPNLLDFGTVPVHVDTHNAQQVTLQNCSAAAFQLDAPQVPAPFSIDSPNFPTALKPGEVAAFSVGFHPTKPDKAVKDLVIKSRQLPEPLTVHLRGEGVATGSGSGAGPLGTGVSSTSFYACGSCTAGDPSGGLAIVLAALAAIAPRRRRRRAGARVDPAVPRIYRPVPPRIFLSSPKNRSISSALV
jgi:MYXO-CTERM domain-containing protein